MRERPFINTQSTPKINDSQAFISPTFKQIVACHARLWDSGEKSFSKKKCEKRAGPPFPSRARLIFALLILIRPHYTIWEPGTGYQFEIKRREQLRGGLGIPWFHSVPIKLTSKDIYALARTRSNLIILATTELFTTHWEGHCSIR